MTEINGINARRDQTGLIRRTLDSNEEAIDQRTAMIAELRVQAVAIQEETKSLMVARPWRRPRIWIL